MKPENTQEPFFLAYCKHTCPYMHSGFVHTLHTIDPKTELCRYVQKRRTMMHSISKGIISTVIQTREG